MPYSPFLNKKVTISRPLLTETNTQTFDTDLIRPSLREGPDKAKKVISNINTAPTVVKSSGLSVKNFQPTLPVKYQVHLQAKTETKLQGFQLSLLFP